jgi:hypothetical protein
MSVNQQNQQKPKNPNKKKQLSDALKANMARRKQADNEDFQKLQK